MAAATGGIGSPLSVLRASRSRAWTSMHEGVEMGAALLRDRQAFVEQVHQHRFAAPDAAPQIEPARAGAGLAPSSLPQQATAAAALPARSATGPAARRLRSCSGSGRKFARTRPALIPLEDALIVGQWVCGSMPVIGGDQLPSPCPTTVPRRNTSRRVSLASSRSPRRAAGPALPAPMNWTRQFQRHRGPRLNVPSMREAGEQRDIHQRQDLPPWMLSDRLVWLVLRDPSAAGIAVALRADQQLGNIQLLNRVGSFSCQVCQPGLSGSGSYWNPRSSPFVAHAQTCRSACIFLISAIARAGLTGPWGRRWRSS